jgi:hypothetical protein
MARLERTLDPTEGPLQEFAFQLRKVRAQAGNPTYRALARTAGYSATTLSEAARGVRKPTLDVVLAYVGACRGDAEEWRRRWFELDAALGPEAAPRTEPHAALSPEPAPRAEPHAALGFETAPRTEPRGVLGPETVPPAAGFGDEAPAGPVRPNGPGPRRWPYRRALLVLAGAALLMVVAVAAGRWPEDRTATESACPRLPATRAFTGETYGSGAPIRAGASPDDPVLSTVPSHCTLGFTGYCLGAKMRDATSGTPDIRWFMLPDGTVVPSAVIHGNPPAKLRPSRCRHDRPEPSAIALEIAADSAMPGGILARATGRNVDIVGFAARQATGPARWQQIGLSEGTDFRATWRPAQPADPHRAITVVAAACLGGGSPTEIIDVRALPSGGSGAVSRPKLSRQELAAAARSACQYPRT